MADVTISQLTKGVPSGDNILPYSTGSNTLGVPVSAIFQNAGNIGIGTTSPSYKLVVSEGGAQGFEVQTSTSTKVDLLTYNRSTQLYTDTQFNSKEFIIRSGNGSSVAENLKVDSSGAVTKPNQPAFAVKAVNKTYVGNERVIDSYSVLQEINTDNKFNINNGKYTVPKSGIYHFSGMLRIDPNIPSYFYPIFYINGVWYFTLTNNDGNGALPGLTVFSGGPGFGTSNFSCLIKLSKDDIFEFGYYIPAASSSSWTVVSQTCLYGYLLG